MIASVDRFEGTASSSETSEAAQADDGCSQEGFLELLPRILAHARTQFRHLSPGAREDAIDEVVGSAFVAYRRLLDAGKADVAYAGPLARFGIANFWRGRRIGTRQNVNDVLSSYCQHSKGLTRWTEIAVEDRSATPADIAALRIDFGDWLRQLPATHRRVAETLAVGETTRDTASRIGVSPGRVSQIRRELRNSWERFQGQPPLA